MLAQCAVMLVKQGCLPDTPQCWYIELVCFATEAPSLQIWSATYDSTTEMIVRQCIQMGTRQRLSERCKCSLEQPRSSRMDNSNSTKGSFCCVSKRDWWNCCRLARDSCDAPLQGELEDGTDLVAAENCYWCIWWSELVLYVAVLHAVWYREPSHEGTSNASQPLVSNAEGGVHMRLCQGFYTEFACVGCLHKRIRWHISCNLIQMTATLLTGNA